MKKNFILLAAHLICFIASTQSITAYRYWFNNDFANATTVTGSFGMKYHLQGEFPVTTLPDGLHTFTIAFRESLNNWSSANSTFFYKKTVSTSLGQGQYQYWFDSGFINALTTSLASTNNLLLTSDIDVASLSNGLHALHIRFKPDGGAWSVVSSSFFYKSSGTVSNGIVKYQYWFDNNVPDSVTTNLPPTANLSLLTDIGLGNLSVGLHVFNVRFQEASGLWSVVKSDFFFKNTQATTNNIKLYRYWFNNNWEQWKEIRIGALSQDEFIAFSDVEGLADGVHTVTSMFKDDGSTWSSPVTTSFTKGVVTTKELVYPKIYLSKATIQAGQNITITGKDFVPNGEVKLSVGSTNSEDFLEDKIIGADATGNISYALLTTTSTEKGLYTVNAFDLNKSANAYPARFEVKSSVAVQQKTVKVISPEAASIQIVNKPAVLRWTDKSKTDKSLLNGKTATVPYNYKLEYSQDNGTWTVCPDAGNYRNGEFKGSYYIGQAIQNTLKYDFIPTAVGTYKIRITDNLNSQNTDNSQEFYVQTGNGEVDAKLTWDSSGPKPNSTPTGVVADGVARLVIEVFKQDSHSSRQIASVNIELSDPETLMNEKRLLGKLKVAQHPKNYSIEANDASLISLSTTSTIQSNKSRFYFWYVAPDDFRRTSVDDYSGIRKVKCDIKVTYTDNTTAMVPNFYIDVVRPPLMLVHGLGGGHNTWNLFRFENQYGEKMVFKDNSEEIFKAGIKTVDLLPTDCFVKNGKRLLNLEENDCLNKNAQIKTDVTENSFQYMLAKARNDGYAANRVDVVCHSMGGSAVRTAINGFPNYYRPSSDPKFQFKNYDSGFVNKLITINTPHNGSPFADVAEYLASSSLHDEPLKDYFKKLIQTDKSFIGAFFKEKPFGSSSIIDVAPSIKDLKINRTAINYGGVSFKATNVKNHLIAGENALSVILGFNGLTCNLLNDVDNTGVLWDDYFDLINKYPGTHWYNSTCTNINNVFENYGFPNFVQESDLVVPLQSQLAGANGRTNQNSKKFTGLSARHFGPLVISGHLISPSIVSNLNVGNHVLNLLNQPINSPYFADIIDANPIASDNVQLRQLRSNLTAIDSIIHYYNNQKIKIFSPNTNSTVFVDSTIDLTTSVNDTSNLQYLRILFQGKAYYSDSKTSLQHFLLQVRPNFLGVNTIAASAFYDSMGYTVIYSDTINLKCQVETLLNQFFIEPHENFLNKGQTTTPIYNGAYANYVTTIPTTDTALHIRVADSTVARFVDSVKAFVALKDTGSTYLIATYQGHADTAYFFISRVIDFEDSTFNIICPSSNTSFFSGVSATSYSYQWQINKKDGNGFLNLTDDSIYSGVTMPTLNLASPPTLMYGYAFRCLIINNGDTTYSSLQTLKFSTTWVGSADSLWNNPVNWKCGNVPDENTDAFIDAGTANNPYINLNGVCRSLILQPETSVKVKAGYKLTITH